jgi:hypothetical protein
MATLEILNAELIHELEDYQEPVQGFHIEQTMNAILSRRWTELNCHVSVGDGNQNKMTIKIRMLALVRSTTRI